MHHDGYAEETFDPADWEEFRALARRMVDDMIDHLAALPSRPAWQPMPEAVRAALSEPVPIEPIGEEAAYRQFREQVLPFPNGNLHPRFFGWVQGNGTPLGMMADMLAAGMNAHLAGFNQAPALVEQQVVNWMCTLLGQPPTAGGLLVTGGSMANLLGLAAARHARAGFNVRRDGMQGAAHPRLTIYGSTETHGWAQKAAELLGLGDSGFRRIAVDADYRIDLPALRAAVAADRARGHRPICVIANAGTVNTGAIDPLDALADYCRDEDLWLHVDGAFGALAAMSPNLRPLVRGLERADSLACDLHKWMYLPFDIACAVVRDERLLRDAFAISPAYLKETARGVIAGGLPFADRGIDLTRGFKALKAWMSLKAYGAAKFARLIDQNVAQAAYLRERIEADPELELTAPVPLNIVCFRFNPGGVSPDELNRINEEILLMLQESGAAVPSSTVLGGRFSLRAAIVNHRTRRADLDLLLRETVTIGRRLAAASSISG